MNYFRILWICLNMAFAFLLLAPFDIIFSIIFIKKRPWFLAWIWSKWVFFISGINYKIEGREHLKSNEHYVFMSNHTHEVDIGLLFMALKRDLNFIIKKEFKNVPFAGWYANLKGHLFVDRSNPRKAQMSLNDGVERLKKRPRSIIIFPEGTYHKDRKIRKFRPGGAVLALKTGFKIVPIAIHSKADLTGLFVKNTWKNPLNVIIGEPFSVKKLDFDDRYKIADNTRQKVLQLIKS